MDDRLTARRLFLFVVARLGRADADRSDFIRFVRDS